MIVPTSQNFTKKERAAVLLAADELTDEQIAAEVGVSRRSLATWKHDPDFQAHIGGIVGEMQAGMLRLRIAKKRERLRVLDELHTSALAVIAARKARYRVELGEDDPVAVATAAVHRMFGRHVPAEALTGLVVEKETVNAAGHRTTEWSVDTALLREIRAQQEQAARELGQWVDKSEVDHRTSVVRIVGVDPEAI